MPDGLARFEALTRSAGPAGLMVVRVLKAKGSTPREAGAFMVVSETGIWGTIGGGRLEMEAIAQARDILKGAANTSLALPLGPEIGQCCGGHVTVEFIHHRADSFAAIEARIAKETARWPEVWIFGGGHVGRALVQHFALLPVRPHLVESRAEELDIAPDGAEKHLVALPESLVGQIAPGGAVIVLTHDHALDFLIVQAALLRDDLAFIGMIGSKTKRATFESRYRKEGGESDRLADLVCPIGDKIADKRPEVIAVTVAAQVIAALAAAGSR